MAFRAGASPEPDGCAVQRRPGPGRLTSPRRQRHSSRPGSAFQSRRRSLAGPERRKRLRGRPRGRRTLSGRSAAAGAAPGMEPTRSALVLPDCAPDLPGASRPNPPPGGGAPRHPRQCRRCRGRSGRSGRTRLGWRPAAPGRCDRGGDGAPGAGRGRWPWRSTGLRRLPRRRARSQAAEPANGWSAPAPTPAGAG